MRHNIRPRGICEKEVVSMPINDRTVSMVVDSHLVGERMMILVDIDGLMSAELDLIEGLAA